MMLLQWKVEKEEGVLVSALGSFVRRSIQKHKEEDNGMRLFVACLLEPVQDELYDTLQF